MQIEYLKGGVMGKMVKIKAKHLIDTKRYISNIIESGEQNFTNAIHDDEMFQVEKKILHIPTEMMKMSDVQLKSLSDDMQQAIFVKKKVLFIFEAKIFMDDLIKLIDEILDKSGVNKNIKEACAILYYNDKKSYIDHAIKSINKYSEKVISIEKEQADLISDFDKIMRIEQQYLYNEQRNLIVQTSNTPSYIE